MTIAVDIRAPQEQTEGTRSQVSRWLKRVGEVVRENEPLIELETDKVTVEVASPGSGVLREILKAEQEEIAPGELLGRIEAEQTAVSDQAAESQAGSAAHKGAVSSGLAGVGAIDEEVDAGTLVAQAGGGAASRARDNSAANRFSPAVRRLLSEHSLDPSSIQGSGLGGRITVEDVLRVVGSGAASARATAGTNTARTSGAVSSAAIEGAGPGGARLIPHTAVRRRIAEHMVESLLHTSPHVTTVFEADMTAVLAHRARHREQFEKQGAPLTLTAYFLQACVEAIRAVPEVNSRWTDDALEVFESVHVGVATALEPEGGLVVPVLRDVQSRDLFGIAAGLNDLVVRARSGRLTPGDMRGGTFTISNHGVSGSLLATPIIINQPQAAILGVGKLEKRVVVMGEDGSEAIAIRPRCYITLTIDHRVMDGHQANRFLGVFVRRLTNWPA